MTETPILTSAEKRALCALADPASPAPDGADLADLRPEALALAAQMHGVDPVVWRKLSAMAPDAGPWAEAVQALGGALHLTTAVTLMLDSHSATIRAAFDEAGLRYRAIKGAAFAQALYPNLADRPYTDIDLLVDPQHLDRAAETMRKLGYTQFVRARFDKSVSNREQKWLRDDAPNVLIEVHTDIVHDPRLRRRLRFGLAELDRADGEGRHPAAGFLALAVVHGTAGHKFHNLKLMVDIAQAVRSMGEKDARHLAVALPRLGMGLELAQSMAVVVALLPDVTLAAAWPILAAAAEPYGTRQYIKADTVLDAIRRDNLRSRLRRHAFRWRQIVQPAG